MFVGGEAGIAADAKAFQHFLYLLQMILADDMGSNDELPVRMLFEEGNKDFLIGLPAGACHENLMLALLAQKSLNDR